MTRIEVYRASGLLCGFCAKGHAGARTSGEYDLVCAGVSALTQTAVNALESVAGIKPQVTLKDGLLSCVIPQGTAKEEALRADIVLRTAVQGLEDIENVYPQHVRVVYTEWR